MHLESVTVGDEAVEAVLVFDADEPLRTSDVLGSRERALAVLPGLAGHDCNNEIGTGFGEELADTEFAHLLEHSALEVMALAGSPESLPGETVWDFRRDGRGVFHVRLGYDHDLVCIGAIQSAMKVVLWAYGRGKPPDVEAEVDWLRTLRKPDGGNLRRNIGPQAGAWPWFERAADGD